MKPSRSDVTWSYANFGLAALVNVLLLPFVIRYLSPSELGLWYVYASIASLAGILDFGFLVSFGRNVTFAWCGSEKIDREGFATVPASAQGPNFRLLSVLLSSARAIYALLGLLTALLIGTLGTWYVLHVSAGSLSRSVAVPSWSLQVIAVVAMVALGYWNPVLRGIGAIKWSNQANVLAKTVQLCITVPWLILGGGLLAVAAGSLASVIVFRAMSVWFFGRYQSVREELRKQPRISIEEVRETLLTIWPNTFKQGLVSATQFAHFAFPIFICGLFLGLDATGSLGVAFQIFGLLKVLGNVLFNAYLPSFAADRVNGNEAALLARVSRALGVAFWTIGLGGICLILLGPPLLGVVGSQTHLPSQTAMLVLLVGEIFYNTQILCGAYLTTGNRVPMYRAYCVSMLLGCCGMVALCLLLDWGVWGIILPLVLADACFNSWYWIMRAGRDTGIGGLPLLRRSWREGARWFMSVVAVR